MEEALRVIEALRRRQMGFTLDPLGEATVSEEEAEAYHRRVLTILDALSPHARQQEPSPLLDRDHRGPLPSANVSLKLSSLYSQFNPLDQARSGEVVKARLQSILRRAREVGAFVTIDMEQYEFKDLTLRIVKELLDEEEFRSREDVGLVLQAYLKDTEHDLRDLLAWVGRRRASIGVRLVKGAYWDYEVVIARQQDGRCRSSPRSGKRTATSRSSPAFCSSTRICSVPRSEATTSVPSRLPWPGPGI